MTLQTARICRGADVSATRSLASKVADAMDAASDVVRVANEVLASLSLEMSGGAHCLPTPTRGGIRVREYGCGSGV
jgi:hypothetical protein